MAISSQPRKANHYSDEMTGRILEVVGARGFEPPTPWSRTGVSENLKRVSHLQAPAAQKSCLSWSTVGPQTEIVERFKRLK